MDNINTEVTNNQIPDVRKNPKKVILFVSIGIAAIAAVSGGYYLYIMNKQSDAAVTLNSTPPPTPTPCQGTNVFTKSLAPGTIGKPYKEAVETGSADENAITVIKMVAGLPKGLAWTQCSTVSNSADYPDESAEKNSLTHCYIEGTPEESGNFKVSIYFSNEDGTGKILKEFDLVINP